MKTKNCVTLVFFMLLVSLLFVFGGPALAQHQGGLGERKVPINIATEEQLMTIEGMTEDLAAAIVKYRESEGYFRSPEDLLKVPGMTQEIFKKINPQQGVEGDIYCVPKEGEFEEEEPLLSPSKC